MRALAHPTRLALLEALLREGPLTATEAATLLGDSPGNISWHLQTLAKYGYIEETGTGRGRSRPWRLVSLGRRFGSSTDNRPGAVAAREALAAVVHDQAESRLQEWFAHHDDFAPAWQDAAFTASSITYLTVEEFTQLSEEILAVMHRYRGRTLDRAERPADAQPVHLVAWGHPIPPHPSGN